MSTRATRITHGNLASDLTISRTGVIIETIVVCNINYQQTAIIEFENNNGNVELVMVVPSRDMRCVNGRVLADDGLIVRALDENILVTVYHTEGSV